MFVPGGRGGVVVNRVGMKIINTKIPLNGIKTLFKILMIKSY